MQDVSLLVFDEAHRAVGDYAYVSIAQQFHKQAKYARILSLTASPGTEQEKILEICKNLYIEEVEIRHQDDPDVKPYIQDIDVSWEYVELPSVFTVIKQHLEKCYNEKLHTIKKFGYLNRGHPKRLSEHPHSPLDDLSPSGEWGCSDSRFGAECGLLVSLVTSDMLHSTIVHPRHEIEGELDDE